MIDVLIVEPNRLPYKDQIPNTLEAKQKIVEGLIECVEPIDDETVCFICNEEGKLNGSLPNRDIGYDILFGTFIIVGNDYENGDFKSLTDSQIKKYQDEFDDKSIIKTMIKYNKIKNIRNEIEY